MPDIKDMENMYGNKLNADVKAELEDLYYSNSGVLQFFKAIDGQIQKMLADSAINIASASTIRKQLSDSLPKLNELKFEITMLTTISETYKGKINQTISYITDAMAISETSNVAAKFFQLLKENQSAIVQEQIAENEQKKKREEAERKEIERIARKEAERKANLAECAKNFYQHFFKKDYYGVPLIFTMFKNIGNWGDDYFYMRDKIYEYLNNLESANITFDFSNPDSYNMAYMRFPNKEILPKVSQLKICNLTSLSFLDSLYNKVRFSEEKDGVSFDNLGRGNGPIFTRNSQLKINNMPFENVRVIKQTPFLLFETEYTREDTVYKLPIYNELILENLNISRLPSELWSPKNYKPKVIIKNCCLATNVDYYFKNYDSNSPFELVLENISIYNK
jgi:hypothetical protein